MGSIKGTALVGRYPESGSFHQGSRWFKKGAGLLSGLIGVYFSAGPFSGV